MKEEKEIEVFLFGDGNMSVLRDGEQVPEAQKPWIILSAEHLKSVGIDPTNSKIYSSDGQIEIFETPTGYNWKIINYKGGL